MIPFYFGSGERRLFGLYRPAERKRAPCRAIVLCHPWGQEYLRAHRSVCLLASMLSAAGFDVLRFDYFGTGDSEGDLPDATLSGWEADIETAIQEIRDTTGATRVALVGLRLGATLAATVAVRRRDVVKELVLWDPVVTGKEYLAELRGPLPRNPLLEGSPAGSASKEGAGLEVRGFLLTETMGQDLLTLDLPALVPALPDRTLFIASEVLASHASLQTALNGRADGTRVLEYIESGPAWLEDKNYGVGVVPVKIIQRIAEWLG